MAFFPLSFRTTLYSCPPKKVNSSTEQVWSFSANCERISCLSVRTIRLPYKAQPIASIIVSSLPYSDRRFPAFSAFPDQTLGLLRFPYSVRIRRLPIRCSSRGHIPGRPVFADECAFRDEKPAGRIDPG